MIAPMVGLSHVAFREWVRGYTPPGLQALRFTEMLSTRRVPSQNVQHSSFLRTAAEEQYFIPQLLGNEERFIAPTIAKLAPKNPWGFDINMGCPVKHTLKHNWGVRLMGDPDYAAEVVRITKRHTNLPVSVKLRGGSEEVTDLEFLDTFTAALADAGADWLTIHARPRAAKHSGAANWEVVRTIRQKRAIPVVANGDIQTADDALRVVQDMQIDGAMIARAATVRPWVLAQIAQRLGFDAGEPPHLAGRALPWTVSEEATEYGQALMTLLDLLEQYVENEADRLHSFLFLCVTGSPWFSFGHSFCRQVRRCKTTYELRAFLIHYREVHGFSMRARVEH